MKEARMRIAIQIALLALGITITRYLFALLGPPLNLYPTTPPQAALVYLVILPVGMSVAFISLLTALLIGSREVVV